MLMKPSWYLINSSVPSHEDNSKDRSKPKKANGIDLMVVFLFVQGFSGAKQQDKFDPPIRDTGIVQSA